VQSPVVSQREVGWLGYPPITRGVLVRTLQMSPPSLDRGSLGAALKQKRGVVNEFGSGVLDEMPLEDFERTELVVWLVLTASRPRNHSSFRQTFIETAARLCICSGATLFAEWSQEPVNSL
jgi:hypothetical protein